MTNVDPIATVGLSTRRLAAIAAWYEVNGRDFPWRRTSDAWELLVAEVLLRRTHARQAEPVVVAILEAFPSPSALSIARLDDVETLVRPAGLVTRSAQLIATATMIVGQFRGNTPSTAEDLQQLPGVGPYVASAVSAAASGCRVVLTDTNTVRVALRVAGVEVAADDVRRQRVVKDSIRDLFGGTVGAHVWWGVIDLAHAVCTPKLPHCDECPIAGLCVYGRSWPNCHPHEVRSTS